MSDLVIQKHSRMPRKHTETQATKRIAGKGIVVPLEKRNEIIAQAKDQILAGLTIAQMARYHGIAERTLEYWLASLGDEYKELRAAWLDGMLTDAGELLKDADNPLAVAKARELWKRATWYAEKRDRARYGEDKAQVNVQLNPILNISVAQDEHRPIEHEPISAPNHPQSG